MTDSAVLDESEEADELAPRPIALIRTLGAVIVVALLVIAGAVGWLVRGSGGGGTSTPSANSVDAGFAQDMAIHHIQAVTMAGYARDNTTNPAVKNLAFDIETSQNFQVGEMQGWLDNWGLSRIDPTPMAWMGHADAVHNGLMPGMATPAQLTKLESLHGTALDILFLQLMIRHHQGGIPMARYASEHASEPYVRTLASSIVAAQSSELIQMEQMLRNLGGQLLPPPQY
jgi:uncharacterized protein (DUF305 family)